jgi:phosphonate transport system substrate-binding protein
VKATSPYKNIEDLKGKNIGLVDPNSTSGNNVPRYMLDKMKINPENYFGKVVFTGSHENAVLALAQGTVDVVANAWNADDDSYLTRMIGKGMLKNADGSSMKVSDFRIILKSDPILNGPLTYLSDLPADAKEAISKAFLTAHTADKASFDKLSEGKNLPWKAAKTDEWKPVVELVQFVDSLRRKN